MYDRQPRPQRYYATEQEIDAALFSNDLKGVDIMLRDSILRAKRESDHKAYHHLSFKNAALPFYRLRSEGYTPENMRGAVQVYSNIGELLKQRLEAARQAITVNEIKRLRGEISELVVYGIPTRDFTEESQHAPLPTRAVDDMAGLAGTDFIITPLYNSGSPEEWVQTKTFLTEDTIYHPYVSLIGLNQLDPDYFSEQWLEESLASSMLRELKGTASTEDSEVIEWAANEFYRLLDEQEENRPTRIMKFAS
jgi:hypothetical protein